jgi:phage baseplate assembly protein gpV
MDGLIDDINGQKNFKGLINIQNTTDISTNNIGALYVAGGVGIQKQLLVNGTITSNGVFTSNGGITSNNAFTSNGSFTSYGPIVSWNNIGIGKIQDSNYKLDVLGDVNINGSLFAKNVRYNDSLNISSSTSNNTLNVTSNQLNINSPIFTVSPNSTNIQVGYTSKFIGIGVNDTPGVGGVLNIGGGTIGGSGPGIDSINIGGVNSKIQINGNIQFANQSTNLTSIIQYSRNFILAGKGQDVSSSLFVISNLYNNNSVNGGGILFQGFNDVSGQSVSNLGQFTISLDGQGYIFKPPTYNTYADYTADTNQTKQNIVKLDVNSIKTTANAGLVILKPLAGDPDSAKYSITSSNIDLSNIFLKDQDQPATGSTQSISTNVIFKGNVYHNNNSIFNNNILVNTSIPINNSILNINGNAIISKLGIGTSSVNVNPNSLEIQGSMYQMNNGFIYQF